MNKSTIGHYWQRSPFNSKHLTVTIQSINQSINQSFICSEQHKKKTVYTIQCRTGHKGVKHLQVPQTKPNNKNTKKESSNVNNAAVNGGGWISY